jgi:hypothetical protein
VQVGAADSTAVQGDTASSAPEKLFTDGSVASAVPSLQEELAVASHGMGNTGDSVPRLILGRKQWTKKLLGWKNSALSMSC